MLLKLIYVSFYRKKKKPNLFKYLNLNRLKTIFHIKMKIGMLTSIMQIKIAGNAKNSHFHCQNFGWVIVYIMCCACWMCTPRLNVYPNDVSIYCLWAFCFVAILYRIVEWLGKYHWGNGRYTTWMRTEFICIIQRRKITFFFIFSVDFMIQRLYPKYTRNLAPYNKTRRIIDVDDNIETEEEKTDPEYMHNSMKQIKWL